MISLSPSLIERRRPSERKSGETSQRVLKWRAGFFLQKRRKHFSRLILSVAGWAQKEKDGDAVIEMVRARL